MKIEEALIRLRDDLKEWVTNNLNAIGSGGGGGSCNIVYLTQAEYEALPDTKLTDDVEYRITDAYTSKKIEAEDIACGDTNVEDAIYNLNESLEIEVLKDSMDNNEFSVSNVMDYKEIRVKIYTDTGLTLETILYPHNGHNYGNSNILDSSANTIYYYKQLKTAYTALYTDGKIPISYFEYNLTNGAESTSIQINGYKVFGIKK